MPKKENKDLEFKLIYAVKIAYMYWKSAMKIVLDASWIGEDGEMQYNPNYLSLVKEADKWHEKYVNAEKKLADYRKKNGRRR